MSIKKQSEQQIYGRNDMIMLEQNNKIEEQEKALLQYKDHMRDSQKRQWDKLDEHEKTLQQVSHALEMCKQEHEKE